MDGFVYPCISCIIYLILFIIFIIIIPMYIERVPNRNSPPAVLLRESFREDGVELVTERRVLFVPQSVTDHPKERRKHSWLTM